MPGTKGISGFLNTLRNPSTWGQKAYQSLGPEHLKAITHNIVHDPVGAMRAGWKKSGVLDKVMIGAAVAPDVLSLAKPTQPGEPGKAERAGRDLGTMVGGVAFNRHPGMIGSNLGWIGSSLAGGMAGKAVGKVTGIGKGKPPLPPGEEPSLHDKLFNKAAAAKKLKEFARKKIREARFQEVEPNKMGDIATATWRDPTGTYERISATENKPHA